LVGGLLGHNGFWKLEGAWVSRSSTPLSWQGINDSGEGWRELLAVVAVPRVTTDWEGEGPLCRESVEVVELVDIVDGGRTTASCVCGIRSTLTWAARARRV
jgi:hypothetical protein